jgi:hypothetical protein
MICQGFEDPTRPLHPRHLPKAIYRLKHAPRAWQLNYVLDSLGFQTSTVATPLLIFYMYDLTMFLLIYIDDIIVISSFASSTVILFREMHSGVAAVKDLVTLVF